MLDSLHRVNGVADPCNCH